MSDVIEVNVQTGERIERDFTPDEATERAAYEAAYEAQIAAAEQLAVQQAAATAAAIAHAKSLGFTDAMIAVMYPNLGAQND